MTTLTFIEYTSYLIVLVGGMYTTYQAGEKSGSIYMLDYLRSNKYKDSNGVDVPFLNDTGYNRFMTHMRKESEKKNG